MILLFLRQVPGLRAVSKRKKKSTPNAPTRTRPPPIDRIAAQRARREAAHKHNLDGQQADFAPAQGRNIQPDDDNLCDDQLGAEESDHEEREEEGKAMADIVVSL